MEVEHATPWMTLPRCRRRTSRRCQQRRAMRPMLGDRASPRERRDRDQAEQDEASRLMREHSWVCGLPRWSISRVLRRVRRGQAGRRVVRFWAAASGPASSDRSRVTLAAGERGHRARARATPTPATAALMTKTPLARGSRRRMGPRRPFPFVTRRLELLLRERPGGRAVEDGSTTPKREP